MVEEEAQKDLEKETDAQGDKAGDHVDDDEIQEVSCKITRKSRKKNKGRARVLWLKEQIAELKSTGRWVGSEAPNAADRDRRLEAEAQGSAW